jgi:hypothetical protein
MRYGGTMIDPEAELAAREKAHEILQSSEYILSVVYKILHDTYGYRMNGIEARILKLAPRKAS